MNLSHEEMRELVAAYTLGAVPPEEEPFIRAHISSCDECMAEADRFGEITASLALAVDSAPLPKDFADKVVAAATGAEEGPAQAAPRRGFRLSIPGLVAGLAIVLAFAVMTTALIQTNNDLRRTNRAVTALVHSEDVVELTGDGAVARVVPTTSETYLIVSGLQEAPTNHTYQLWFMDEGTPVSAGVFDVSDGLALVETEISFEDYDGAAVSVEPDGGSRQPTTTPIMVSGGSA